MARLMKPLFDRIVELKIGDTDITGLDIAFDIEKDENPEPNPCHVEVFNLGSENRATLSKYKQVPVVLKAGCKGQLEIIYGIGMCLKLKAVNQAAFFFLIGCKPNINPNGLISASRVLLVGLCRKSTALKTLGAAISTIFRLPFSFSPPLEIVLPIFFCFLEELAKSPN